MTKSQPISPVLLARNSFESAHYSTLSCVCCWQHEHLWFWMFRGIRDELWLKCFHLYPILFNSESQRYRNRKETDAVEKKICLELLLFKWFSYWWTFLDRWLYISGFQMFSHHNRNYLLLIDNIHPIYFIINENISLFSVIQTNMKMSENYVITRLTLK